MISGSTDGVPITYAVDESAHTVQVRGEGIADVAQCDAVARAVASYLNEHPGWPVLCDARHLAWVPWPDEIRQLATLFGQLRASFTGPMAVVTDRPALYGMARMLSTLVEPFGLRMMTFREMDEAIQWCRTESMDDRMHRAS